MKLTVDTQQRIQSGLIFLLECYKVLMGSFLVVFVPQECGDDGHLCTLAEKEMAYIIINAVSCLMLVYLYYIELTRENWCIKYLDIDPFKPNNNLDTEIEKYPDLKKQMATINKRYKRESLICCATQLINIIASLVHICLRWGGSDTLTPLISYIILMVTKLYNTYFISTSSLSKERAYSGYLTISKTYNTIDEDHKNIVI